MMACTLTAVDVRACRGCGCAVADVDAHAGNCVARAMPIGQNVDLEVYAVKAVEEFLASIEPDALEQGMLGNVSGLTGGDSSMGVCALRWLKEQV